MFGMNKMDESVSVSNTQMGLLIDDSTKPTSANVSMNFLDQGVPNCIECECKNGTVSSKGPVITTPIWLLHNDFMGGITRPPYR